MGLDLHIRLRKRIHYEEEKSSDFFFINRGVCNFFLNAINVSSEIIDSMEKVLNTNVSFILEAEHIDNSQWAEYLDKENTIIDLNEEPSGWVSISPFLEKLYELRLKIKEIPNFEEMLDYDREWWGSYFKSQFTEDIDRIIDILKTAQKQGESEFTLDAG